MVLINLSYFWFYFKAPLDEVEQTEVTTIKALETETTEVEISIKPKTEVSEAVLEREIPQKLQEVQFVMEKPEETSEVTVTMQPEKTEIVTTEITTVVDKPEETTMEVSVTKIERDVPQELQEVQFIVEKPEETSEVEISLKQRKEVSTVELVRDQPQELQEIQFVVDKPEETSETEVTLKQKQTVCTEIERDISQDFGEIEIVLDRPEEVAPTEVTLVEKDIEQLPQEIVFSVEKPQDDIDEIEIRRGVTTTVHTEVDSSVEAPSQFEFVVENLAAEVTADKMSREIMKEVTTEIIAEGISREIIHEVTTEMYREGPVFIREITTVETTLTEEVRFECQVTGVPAPTLQWYHNGETLRGDRYIVINYNDGVSELFITEVTEDDVGMFMCEAVNPLGRATTVAQLTITTGIVFHRALIISMHAGIAPRHFYPKGLTSVTISKCMNMCVVYCCIFVLDITVLMISSMYFIFILKMQSLCAFCELIMCIVSLQ